MENGETTINLNLGGNEMAVDFNHSRLNFAIREKGWNHRAFRQKLISEFEAMGQVAPSEASINNWLAGRSEPRNRFVKMMSTLLGKPMEFFCVGEAS